MTGPVVTGTAIGRYFTVVSLVPSIAFVAYVMLLVRSGSWTGDVDFAAAATGLDLGDLALFGVSALVVAMALHPLQFAIIQAFEGFWGATAFGRRLAVRHILRHRDLATRHKESAIRADARARPERGKPGYDETAKAQMVYASEEEASAEHVEAFFTAAEAWRRYGRYPHEFEYIMPTQLGNVLRRYELLAGRRFGLDTISAVPRLMQVADGRDVAYVHNQRTQMELALRTAALALVATLVTLLFMWGNGLWLLLSLAPYGIAYASYRGAVVIAHEYGTALAVLVELNRFALYERMHLPIPDTLTSERRHNRRLTDMLRLDNVRAIERWGMAGLPRYSHPAPPFPAAGQADTPSPPDGD